VIRTHGNLDGGPDYPPPDVSALVSSYIGNDVALTLGDGPESLFFDTFTFENPGGKSLTLFARIVLASLIIPGQILDDKVQDPTKQAEGRLAVMKSEAARYSFHTGAERQLKAVLQPEPLLRWSNPIADEEDAALFLWTRDGRPEAAAQFFVRKDIWMHEFQSLSPLPFAVEWDGQEIWTPEKPGLRFEAVPNVPLPGKTAVERARQMREIAGTFAASVEFNYREKSRYELRLLSRAVYRYGGEVQPFEGAVWAFVQGTNPEVLLLIEARRPAGSEPEWKYAIAPMTSYPAEVKRAGRSIWKVERQPIPTPTTTGIYLFRHEVPMRTRDK
jgi:hypothetical protein